MALILIIEDDEEVRKMLRMTLSQFGHTVIEARNGREGLALYESQGADLVITDLVMPEKEGLEVLMELRNRQPKVKIIAISGGGRQSPADNLHMAKLFGATRVFAKPVPKGVLMAAVNEVLSGNATSPE